MTDERVEIEDPRDRALLAIAQGSTMNDTVLPSGYRTPRRDLIVDGTALRTPTGPEGPSARTRRRPPLLIAGDPQP